MFSHRLVAQILREVITAQAEGANHHEQKEDHETPTNVPPGHLLVVENLPFHTQQGAL